MTKKVLRDIIRIDEEKCDGCGACAIACAEGAIQIVDGKARLISENYCDGLGACLGECPQGALSIEKRQSDEFDETAVEHHLESISKEEHLPCGCPGTAVKQFNGGHGSKAATPQESMLTHWPVQLALGPPNAPFLQRAELLLAAHCAPFAYGDFHQDFIKGHAVVCACPKLDDIRAHRQKLTEILRESNIRSLTVVHMEVPCCGGLALIARQALAASGKNIPLSEVTLGIKGDILIN
jgi:Pyruvate/2-oxoacid:ferredoxin oxidoreductase delta subunit